MSIFLHSEERESKGHEPVRVNRGRPRTLTFFNPQPCNRPPLINTPFQRGGTANGGCVNRFSGFHAAPETAEAVRRPRRHTFTPLKRGANQSEHRTNGRICATTHAMRTCHQTFALALALVASALSLSTVQRAEAAAWTTNSPMIAARYGHTVTLLPNGKLLAAGGCSTNLIPSINYLSTAELYDSASGTWTITGAQVAPRAYHTATLLPGGKVLIVGGYNSSSGLLSSAELYDPASGTWTPTGALATAREYHTATLLPNGMVLVVGGETNQIVIGNRSLTSAELYDPATGKWTPTGPLKFGRYQHTATLLQNGKVLVAGGSGYSPTTAAELYRSEERRV